MACKLATKEIIFLYLKHGRGKKGSGQAYRMTDGTGSCTLSQVTY